MRIYIVGVPCVGKSTIGKVLAEKLGNIFINFDSEVEKRMGEFISTLKNRHFNEYGYREEVKHILQDILKENKSDVVITMPPGGMFSQIFKNFKEKS